MSFFQEVKQSNNDARIIGYRMHDIIYDLAQSVAGTEFSIIDHTSAPRYPAQIRHSSVVCDFRSGSIIPEEFYKAKHLRTLFIFSEGGFREVPHKLFSSFRYLRELDMSGCGLEVLDGSIGDLICLRYLDISYTHIKELPCSIEKLLFLQTLNVAGCYNLTSLPQLANMSNLRHLNNTGCIALTSMLPLNRPFNQLQRHTELSAEEHNEHIRDIKLLERLDLRGTLKITHLENLHDQGGIDFHALNRMKGVESLGLYWGDDDHCPNINREEDYVFTRFQERKQVHSSGPSQRLEASESLELLITRLHPNKYVKRLTVKGYLGIRFPDYWLLSSNLTVVNLIDFGKCEELPSLGHLKLLNSLSMRKMPAVRRIDIRFYVERHLHSTTPPFPVLRELVLIDFPNLEAWSSPDDGNAFPSLRKLIVSKCPKLNMMPKIPSIQHLELRDCNATLVHSFQKLTSLTVLVIEKARGLSSFPGVFPVNNHLLTTLDIISCPLQRLPNFGNLTALKALTIRWCQELSYLPQGMQILCALESLEIGDCHSLMFLPEIGYGGFSNLKTLSIENCNNLTSLSMGFKNLTLLEHLIIMYCPSLVTLPQGIQNLSALQSLTILGCCPEFMSLPEELQNLTRLHSLEIRSCPGLEALPEWIEKLVSLRTLAISDCQCITSLPESMVRLTGLQHLSIQDCSQLLERCRPQDGEDWPKIVHVPYKHIGPPELSHPSEASSSSN
ncbi:hypothetical protein FEM48_Zijuj09G0090100 [Ziziphus jujuba var. spinosa]|uniref:R13L1/DRL21-like LRR repeat region domain-containing protein n=1 Tax=Ziziphus jujuba var. spinosa TaxID=714518 RepID=A0A978US29_ZIZJJ|nr:hypothetical protein FEM48_Zijuj09G0090100 [Ziziphus jujuba var. spinosa]